MVVTDLVTLVLLGTAAVFAIIELGLSAYIVSLGSERVYTYYDPNYAGTGYGGYQYGTRRATAPAEVDFLLFCSLWTLLVTPALIIFPIIWRTKANVGGRDKHTIFGPLTLALNAVTMIFWLAGFAALANLYGGGNPQGIAGALLAFAVMLWLIFLALLVLNFLTAFEVMRSERLGWHPMFKRRGIASSHQPGVAETSRI